MYPLKFEPIYKNKIWGGRNLKRIFNKNIHEESVGESWEIASHENGESIIKNGTYKSMTIQELVTEQDQKVLGEKAVDEYHKKFPLLIKLIDAQDNLSVQVHPDDQYASRFEDGESGKTELWYILNAEPGAKIIYGLQENINKEQFKEAIKNSSINKLLNEVEVKTGDFFYIPAGTVHAIGKGIMIAEIQQNSDTTYRVYDWDRVDDKGNSRDLHINKALDVIDFNRNDPIKAEKIIVKNTNYKLTELINTEYFNIRTVEIYKRYKADTKNKRFYIYMNLGSEVTINYNDGKMKVRKGETILIPAALGEYEIVGQTKLLKSFLE